MDLAEIKCQVLDDLLEITEEILESRPFTEYTKVAVRIVLTCAGIEWTKRQIEELTQ